MKTNRLLLVPMLLITLIFTACSGSAQPVTSASPAETTAEPATETAEAPTGAELSELAMDNFLKKIDEGNYTINAGNFLKTSVFSRDLVWFEYVDDAYNDFAAMSVNNETFQAFLNEDGMTAPVFVSEGQAIEAAGSKLINHWLDEDVSEGNIYNLFYNSTEEPLTFISYEDAVKQSLISFAGYGENALPLMHEVYMVMDDADPSVVHLTAEVDEDAVARIAYDDIDIEVTFGDAEDNPEAENWMSDPVYPEARTAWTEADSFVFNSVFLPGWGDNVIPFPAFASYAFTIDQENFVMSDEVDMRDPHATEQDMADYIDLLLKDGFSEVTETGEDGTEKIYYRKMLREAFSCYVQVELEYNDGLDMVAKKYYDMPVYDSIDAINEAITGRGYLALPTGECIRSVNGYDRADEVTESWLYFFDYDMYLEAEVDYTDIDAVKAYLDTYVVSLVTGGFHPVAADDEEEYYFESGDGSSSFRYVFGEDNVLHLLYKAERYISAEEAEGYLAEAGFPAIDLKTPITCRDLTLFQKEDLGQDFKIYLSVSQTFAAAGEAEQFLNDYEAALNAAGFERSNPEIVATNKPVVIYNEAAQLLVGIDLIEEDDNTFVNFDFWAK